MVAPARGPIHPLIAPVPVRASVGTVHGGRYLGSKEHGDKAVEQTSSEGDDGHWDDLLTEVGLSLRVLSGPSITLKQTKHKTRQSSVWARLGDKTCGRVEAE